jgi:hypothetical protein
MQKVPLKKKQKQKETKDTWGHEGGEKAFLY